MRSSIGRRLGTEVGLTVGALVLGVLSACTGRITSPPSQTGSGSNGAGASSTRGGAASGSGAGGGGASSSGAGGAAQTGNAAAGNGSSVVPLELATGIPAAQPCSSNSPGPAMLRRLTGAQLTATLVDLFNDPAVPVVTVFSDPQILGFTNEADALVVQGLTAQQLADYAEQVAQWAVTNKLATLSSCATMDTACRQSFIASFGKRAFREPLTPDRVQAYDGLMTAEQTFANGVTAVITAMLQSPFFLYRREIGAGGGGASLATLTPYEVASSLSYLLLGSMPDAPLMSAADAGALATRSQIDTQAARLLQDPRSESALMDFFSQWLGLGRLDTTVKDDTVFQVSDSLKASLKGEASAFIMDVFNSGGTVANLLTANYSFVNPQLAQYYGIPQPTAAGNGFVKVAYDATVKRDGGILGQAGLLTGYADAAISSPVLRGKLVRTRLMCQSLPPPPANLDTMLKPPAMAETTRQHFEAHSQNAVCATCHTMMDPIGFGFEHYDGFGRWRDQENGFPIDASGAIVGAPGGDVKFNGLPELSAYLASNAAVNTCAVRFWAFYAYGTPTWDQDACTYDAIEREVAPGNTKLRDVLMAVLHAQHFIQRVSP